MTHPPDFTHYSVRNVKTFTGAEGRGFSATLCKGGKAIASVLDDAWGGCHLFTWANDAEEAALKALCAEVPREQFEDMSIAFDMDQLVNRLVDGYEHEKRLRRIAKTRTLFRINGDEPDTWRQLNATGEKAVSYLRQKYGGEVERIYGQDRKS